MAMLPGIQARREAFGKFDLQRHSWSTECIKRVSTGQKVASARQKRPIAHFSSSVSYAALMLLLLCVCLSSSRRRKATSGVRQFQQAARMLWKPGGACFQTTPILHNQHIYSCPTRYLIHPAAPQRLSRICASKESVGPDGKARKSSFYKRPSKAIEMGGGFFIPGLEGYRLRLASALLVIVLLLLNRLPGYDPARSQVISEVVGISAAVILLIQALVDKGIEDAVARAATRRPGSDISDDTSPESGEYSALTDADADDDARWSGFALSEVVGAGAVVLLDRREGVVYSRSGAGRVGEKDRAAAVATDLINGLGGQKDVKRLEEVVDRQVLASIREGLQGLGDILEGSVVVRVGEHRTLVVAPRGKDQRIRKDDYVWIQQTAGLLAGSKQRVGAFTEP